MTELQFIPMIETAGRTRGKQLAVKVSSIAAAINDRIGVLRVIPVKTRMGARNYSFIRNTAKIDLWYYITVFRATTDDPCFSR